jgi:hypothetical protein
MNRRLPGFLLSAVSIFATGCAVQGRPFERVSPPPAHAVIYVYRPYAYGGSALRPEVTCGEDTVRIGPGGYHAFIVPADQKITCTTHSDVAADEVEIHTSTRVTYLREEIGWGLLQPKIAFQSNGQPHLNPIDNDAAQTEIQSCCVQEQPEQQTQQAP